MYCKFLCLQIIDYFLSHLVHLIFFQTFICISFTPTSSSSIFFSLFPFSSLSSLSYFLLSPLNQFSSLQNFLSFFQSFRIVIYFMFSLFSFIISISFLFSSFFTPHHFDYYFQFLVLKIISASSSFFHFPSFHTSLSNSFFLFNLSPSALLSISIPSLQL